MRSLIGIFAFAAAVAAAPFFVSSGYALNAIIMTLYAALLGQAWNILGGFGGQFSFGHAVFFGTGAYAMGVLQVKFGWNAWAAAPVAASWSRPACSSTRWRRPATTPASPGPRTCAS